MQYRYRVKGKVEQSFILRGAYFAIGSTIEIHITENELVFIREHCKLEKVEDLQKTTNAENSISNVVKRNTKSNQRTIENGKSKRTNNNGDTIQARTDG